MSLDICVICISKKLKQKLKDNLFCYFKCSFKYDKLDFKVQFSFKDLKILDCEYLISPSLVKDGSPMKNRS